MGTTISGEPSFRLRGIALPAFGPTALAGVAQGAVLPVLALRARGLGASVGFAALVVGLLGIGQLVAALPAGSLVSRVGERRALIAAAVADAVAMAGGGLAPRLWVLCLTTSLAGMTAAVFNLARQGYVTDAVPVGMRARALSTLGGVGRIGLFIGPFLGAAAVHQWGTRGAYAVGLVAALAALGLLLVVRDLTAGHETAGEAATRASVWSVLQAHRHTLATLGVGVLVIAAARAARNSLLPLWAESIGLSAADTSLVFGLAGAVDMLLFYPAGGVMDRFGRVWIAVPTVVVLGVGMMALPLTGSMLTLTLVAVLLAVGNGIGSGVVMTLGADAAPVRERPQFLGGWRLCADFGATIGPLLVTVITLVAPLAAACVALGALSVVGGGWLARWVPRFDPRRRSR